MALEKILKNSSGIPTGEYERIAGGTLWAEMPLASLIPFTADTDKIPTGFCLADGRALSRTTYAELFALIGTTYGSGDGSTTFNIPDMREATAKGTGLTSKSNNHYDSDGVALGEFVEDRLQDHSHRIPTAPNSSPSASNYVMEAQTPSASATVISQNEVAQGRSGATTEVKAVGVNWIYKIKIVALPADLEAQVEEAVVETVGETTDWINTITGVSYRKKNGIVFVHINYTVATAVSFDVTIGTLPVGFRPQNNVFGDVVAHLRNTHLSASIKSNGVITIYSTPAGTQIDADGYYGYFVFTTD